MRKCNKRKTTLIYSARRICVILREIKTHFNSCISLFSLKKINIRHLYTELNKFIQFYRKSRVYNYTCKIEGKDIISQYNEM